ncbi:NAD-dependent epimerase/dehydratase family protein [Ornithinimicrobium avium]|uniref:NAD(P)-dependent oxidoreductase n=1 Tax=Ornithinimicrobium avium TaxID=2283195 RepID=A0A345NNP3_9MICO|nr:NAD(P)-dependent oxidoreductase [Ornithinimicrobium avium]AXH96651.1 NAD(P)-dependent oxidoreductase [Ornithinimicrobium avium]
MSRPTVLVTGAAGTVGGDVLRLLRDDPQADLDLVLTDAAADEQADPPVRALDVRDLEATTSALGGVDTVIHLAGASSPQASWEEVLDLNVVGTRTVLEAARRAGVRRVVLASSNHVMGMYDREHAWPVYGHQPVRPDSLYGVSKAMAEVLGRYYHDEHGLEVIALRIGWESGDRGAADDEVTQAMWVSPGDMAQALRRAVQAQVRYGVYYVVSDNPTRRWDLTNTMVELGYRPRDSWQEDQPKG